MPQITKSGRNLAQRINRYLPNTTWEERNTIRETCSLIHRHAVSYHYIQERYCNGHPIQQSHTASIQLVNRTQERYDRWLNKRENQLTKRISELVTTFSSAEHGRINVRFQGDPRGRVVILVIPLGKNGHTREIGV